MSQVTLGKKFIEFLKKNGLRSYNESSEKYFYLPYSSVKKNIRVYIFVSVIEEFKTLKIGFRASLLKEKNNLDEIRETLLDLNARLTTGALALEKNSNVVEYSINYTVEDEEQIDIDRYNRIISFCMNLFYDLYDRKIIERENSMDE